MKSHFRFRLPKRIASGLMALLMVAAVPVSVMARTAEEVEAEQKQLEQERLELQAKLEQLREDEAQKQEYQETLEKKIEVLETQISTANRDIEELNGNINELTLKLDKSKDEMSDTIEQFRQRVAAIYRAGSVSTLEVLLNSNSFSDFSMRSELLNSVSHHDQELIDKISQYMDDTRDEREEREKQKATVADLKKGLEAKQKELDELYAENAQAIADLQGAQGATAEELDRNEAEMDANVAEMQAIIEEQKRREEEERKRREEEERRRQEEAAANGGSGGGGATTAPWTPNTSGGVEGFRPCWPMPGVTYISDEYGGARGHGGMDIAGPYYTPIVAAESGTVIDTNTSGWGGGWGHYVLIYHNDTYSTRYAHMSDLNVSTGQYVNQGDVIGWEGNTGDSTGPHLHFEVYQNGVRVNPRNFLF
ncbi:hypothetical protein D7X94_10135 [Acutalibacter sp. 1XD8-33]|uniref:murein hydrolase activator EnvC family protein n=1 Tax=Acutalibacter sp. 1XD8-33 TaxID=2320081 RepID=UPI000EA2F7CC|nr:M23 family metallopeptidase [Acutalibacter sp. 1XD8-33]RKJ39976.1 hypothetical protein D7X94_10135 [Acutalibacter sp. 1XD8-33]